MSGTLKDSIEKAAEIREGFFGSGTDAFRLFDGAGDGRDGLFIDDFAGHWLVQTREIDFPRELREGAVGDFRSLWWKRLEQEGRKPPEWIRGERLAAPFEIRENGCGFLVDFEAGYSQGIFLDQRLNRAAVLKKGRNGGEILNTFAYTCGFSVAAAAGGARTVSVDLSEHYLEWGRRNFACNGLDAAGHEFRKGDVAEEILRFGRGGRIFDGVILDPPTFSRSRGGKVFRVEKHLGELVSGAARLVSPGGWMLCCSNCRSLDSAVMKGLVAAGLNEAGREWEEMRESRMPPEYRGEKYLKSFWIEVA